MIKYVFHHFLSFSSSSVIYIREDTWLLPSSSAKGEDSWSWWSCSSLLTSSSKQQTIIDLPAESSLSAFAMKEQHVIFSHHHRFTIYPSCSINLSLYLSRLASLFSIYNTAFSHMIHTKSLALSAISAILEHGRVLEYELACTLYCLTNWSLSYHVLCRPVL